MLTDYEKWLEKAKNYEKFDAYYFAISPNNMPTEVWAENRYGEKSTRLF